ncbi:FkbM family methyltransferase [Kitasatospora sp. NPDC089509]|uniref:FkbM family methyltransferase n=1 Tax=Kitasatospora sp. NPDC089509 TaxID=3364079 RepID=UPI0037F1B930
MRYLRRDEDSPNLSAARLLLRAAAEARTDVTSALRAWGRRGGIPLAWTMMRYHAALATGRNGTGRVRSIRLGGPDGQASGRGGTAVRCHFRTDLSDLFVLRETFVQQIYRFPYAEHLGQVTRILDLGSNIGLSPLYFAHLFPSAEIVCVEPVPGNTRLVQANRDRNGFGWRIEHKAVAAQPGQVTLYTSGWWASSSTTWEVSERRRASVNRPESVLPAETRDVPAVTVRGVLDEAGWAHADIVKMDIEGAEHEVLTSGETGWLSQVGILVLDIHGKYVDRQRILEVLAEHGFTAAAESGPHSAVFLSPTARDRAERSVRPGGVNA